MARSTPSREQLDIWRDYIETADAVSTRLANKTQAESGLTSGDYKVLLALSEAEGRRLRSSELARVIEWERSRLSHHLGRMEKRGLISREDCPDDNRGQDVIMTDSGADLFRRGSVPHLKAVREIFVDAFNEDDLETLAELTTRLRIHLGLPDRSAPGRSIGTPGRAGGAH